MCVEQFLSKIFVKETLLSVMVHWYDEKNLTIKLLGGFCSLQLLSKVEKMCKKFNGGWVEK